MKPRITEYKIILCLVYLFIIVVIPYITKTGAQFSNENSPELKFDRVILGKASWYGVPFHGRMTASGDIYDMNKLTAAHKSLPLDSIVKAVREIKV